MIKGRTLSRSTFDCRVAVAFSWSTAAAFTLAEAFNVTDDFGGRPFLLFGGATATGVVLTAPLLLVPPLMTEGTSSQLVVAGGTRPFKLGRVGPSDEFVSFATVWPLVKGGGGGVRFVAPTTTLGVETLFVVIVVFFRPDVSIVLALDVGLDVFTLFDIVW